ncbi:MAG: peptide deformylase [Fimbriimonadaceae bacterium]
MEVVVPEEFRYLYDDPKSSILKVPNGTLRKKAEPMERVVKRHRLLGENMVKIMRDSYGIGLAAPQVGVEERVIVVAPGGQKPIVMFNPEILEREGNELGEEGCLSIPGLYGDVERAERIVVKALDKRNDELTFEMEGLAARVVQHEIDHLDGVLFIDKVAVETLHWRHPQQEFREE